MLQILAISIVLTTEGLNTAIEKIANFIHPDYHEKIGVIKNVSTGAITFSAIFYYSIWCSYLHSKNYSLIVFESVYLTF